MTARKAWRPSGPSLLTRHVLRQSARSLAISLAIVLLALVLERILRLFNLVADQGSGLIAILSMAANLIPHYLGLALPAAFFISVFLVTSRFAEDHELDAWQASGVSLRGISAPFLWLGLALAAFSLILSGYLQPHTRYSYRAILHGVTQSVWDARIPAGTFTRVGDYVIYAREVDSSGHRLRGVFLQEKVGDVQIVTTAERGAVIFGADGETLRLSLRGALRLRTDEAGSASLLRFDSLEMSRPYPRDIIGAKPRGETERELTTPELWRRLEAGHPSIPARRLAAEFNARLVRAATVFFLPMLAMPMGLAAKRARRGYGIAIAAVILGGYHHTLQLGESLVDSGRAGPLLALWLPFALFALLCAFLFLRCGTRPGEAGLGGVLERLRALARPFATEQRPGSDAK